MPCTAKKVECKRKQLASEGAPDTDFVLTTQELGRMIKEAGIDFKNLKPEAQDSPFGAYSWCRYNFWSIRRVAEAATRTAYEFVTGEELKDVDIKAMRGTSDRSRSIELDLKVQKLL